MKTSSYSGPWFRAGFAFIYLILASSTLYIILSRWTYDDPFITYRYARNLARGLGFVYNPGERVLSTTTPLFTLLLAGLYKLSSDLPRLANLIGAISLAVGALLIWELARTWAAPAVGWAGLLLYPTLTLPAATVGSETPLYIAICLAAFVLYAHRSYDLCAVAAALATLTRPDGILLAVVLAGHYILRSRNVPWRAALIYAAIILPWLVFAWFYFGNPIPVTLTVKQYQGKLEVSQYFAPGMLWILSWYRSGWQYWIELLLALFGLYWCIRSSRAWGLVLTWTGLYFLAYSILGISRYFWYYAPLVPGFIILVGLGVQALAYFLQLGFFKQIPRVSQPRWERDVQSRSNPLSYLPNLITAALLLPLALGQIFDLWTLGQNPDPKGPVYKAGGEWLRANTTSETLVGSLEAGILGYYSDRPMVDFAGLIKPDVAHQMVPTATYDEVGEWAMTRYAPKYAVLVSGDLLALKDAYLDKKCQIVQQIENGGTNRTSVSIYTCP